MTEKDKKAKERQDAEGELHRKISKLLEKYSLKYDLSLANIQVSRNYFFGRVDGEQPPMYLIDTSWYVDYMAK